ncbi:hypothetical protein DV735_g3832, partial [Chaetothyriales sp. CBS 134920]
MAALQSALQALSPVDFSDVPTPVEELDQYLADLHAQAQTIVESIPIADPDEGLTRSRAKTISSVASNASEISASAARSEPPEPHIASLQKEWGKPLKIKHSENLLGISVYKTAGKDGKGSWFARRSVHEGLGFARFKAAFQKEFPTSLAVQGAAGEGNIRGIGAESRVEQIKVPNRGKLEVYRLSAQFPGPTTPRDFVTLLITSSNAMKPHDDTSKLMPRSYMIISKPCNHPETQPRSGYIRGQYESVEFIREVPRKLKTSASQTNLSHLNHGHQKHSHDMAQDMLIRNAEKIHAQLKDDNEQNDSLRVPVTHHSRPRSPSPSGRRRSHTVDTAEAFSRHSQDGIEYDPEDNPVEWIMVTRSDPGGSVPRFLVERGTPGSICSDAVKFLDWACQLDEDDEDVDSILSPRASGVFRRESVTAFEKEQRLANVSEKEQTRQQVIDEDEHVTSSESVAASRTNTSELSTPTHADSATSQSSGVVASSSAQASNIVPQTVLTAAEDPSGADSQDLRSSTVDDDRVSTLSTISWVSAESHMTSNFVSRDQSTTSLRKESVSDPYSLQLDHILLQHEKAMLKLSQHKDTVDLKLAHQREKLDKQKEHASDKDHAALKKAEEKHEREVKKHRERHERDLEKLNSRKETEIQKVEAKHRKHTEKSEKDKLRLERDEAVKKLHAVEHERNKLIKQVAELEKQNAIFTAGTVTVCHPSVTRRLSGHETGNTMPFETKDSLLPPFGIRELYDSRTGILHLSHSQYESTVRSCPDAALTYVDDDDGEVITVGSGLELEQRLGEPIRIANRRQSNRIQGSTSRRGSVDDSMMHLFDIQHSDNVLAIWRDHEAFSSRSWHHDRTSPVESDHGAAAAPIPQPDTVSADPTAALHTTQPKAVGPLPQVHGEAQSTDSIMNTHVPPAVTASHNTPAKEFQQDLDAIFSAACSGLLALGLADILDNTAKALYSLAQKQRDAEATPVEALLGGFKDVVSEIGQRANEIILHDLNKKALSSPNTQPTPLTNDSEDSVCQPAEGALEDSKISTKAQKRAEKQARRLDRIAQREARRALKKGRKGKKTTEPERKTEDNCEIDGDKDTTQASDPQNQPSSDEQNQPSSDEQNQPALALKSSKRVSFNGLQDEIRSSLAGSYLAGAELPLPKQTLASRGDLLTSAPLDLPPAPNWPVLPAVISPSPGIPASIMDIESSNADFTARYPPLTSLRRTQTVNELVKKTHDEESSNVVSTKAALSRYPTIRQLETQRRVVGLPGRDQIAAMRADVSRQFNQLKAELRSDAQRVRSAKDPHMSDTPLHGLYSARAVPIETKPLPGSWPEMRSDQEGAGPTVESSGAFFNRMAGIKPFTGAPKRPLSPALSGNATSSQAEQGIPLTGLRRAQTVTASNPAARLTRPFDPLASAPHLGLPKPENSLPHRSLSLRHPPAGKPRLSTAGPGAPLLSLGQPQLPPTVAPPTTQRHAPPPLPPHMWRGFESNPGPQGLVHQTLSVADFQYPSSLTSRRSDSQASSSPTSAPNRVNECIKTLTALGYGLQANEAARLHVYASAAAGKLDEAIDMIEEDRKAASALASGTTGRIML